MDFTLNSDTFLANLNANNLKTPIKQQKLPLAQLIMSSPDMLGSQIIMRPSQRTILKSKKQRAVASPDKLHETFKTHKTDTTSHENHETSRETSHKNSNISQNSDKMLQETPQASTSASN